MKKIAMMMCLAAGLGGCCDSAVFDFDAAALVRWPAIHRPAATTLFTTPPANGTWMQIADGSLAEVHLDNRLFTVAGTDAVYARLLVINTTRHEQGVLLHAEDVIFDGQFVLPPPAGAKLAVSEEEFAAGVAAPGPLPEQQVGEAAPDQARRGVLVTVPSFASLEVFRLVENARRGTVDGSTVTVLATPGVVATDGRCFERLAGEAVRDIQAPAIGGAWPQVPLGSLVLSNQGPARLVPSKQPNLIRPLPEAMPQP
jgi:hypothetical protein